MYSLNDLLLYAKHCYTEANTKKNVAQSQKKHKIFHGNLQYWARTYIAVCWMLQ